MGPRPNLGPVPSSDTDLDATGTAVASGQHQGQHQGQFQGPPPGPSSRTPHTARIYDFWVGGKDNYAVDRQIARQVAEIAPWVVAGARANRAFLTRAVTWLARSGVDQFVDLGCGLPTAGNTHEVAQAVNSDARVVYVDSDDLVLAHARALLARDARTIAVAGDVRDPDAILDDPDVRAHLDPDRPVAVLMLAVLHFLCTPDEPAEALAALRRRLPAGSYVAISHVADLPAAPPEEPPDRRDGREPAERSAATQAAARLYQDLAGPFTLRTPEQITGLFTGLDVVPPGIVPAHLWRPGRGRPGPAVPLLVGVGRTPTSTGPQP